MPKHKKGSAIKQGMEETGQEHGLGSHFFKHAEKVKHYANEYAVRAELDGISKALRHLFKDDEKLTPDQETELKAKIQAETEKRKAGIAPTTTYSTIDFTSTSTSTRRASGRPAAKGENEYNLTPLADYVNPAAREKVKKIRDLVLGALRTRDSGWTEAMNSDLEKKTISKSLHLIGKDPDIPTTNLYYVGDDLDTVSQRYNDAVKKVKKTNSGDDNGDDQNEFSDLNELRDTVVTGISTLDF
jgi:hypothetical protein